MALVASVYKASADKHFQNLLLLDEVDASLHPAMMQNMLDVIERIFRQQGVKVILITHSPTTIALAPENSIYVMNRSGSNRIEKKSKQEALSVLTQGFATIEEGLKLFDQIAKSKLTIISEGNNTRLINKALELNNITDVEVLNGIEAKSGQNQLKTLYQFFTMISHQNKVLFIWDCDVSLNLKEENNTFPFIIPKNTCNSIANTGIENAFPNELFNDFCKEIKRPNGDIIYEFDKGYKCKFELFLLGRNNANDFSHFNSLINEIRRIQSL